MEKVEIDEHPIDDCVTRVLASPVAARQVLNGLAELAAASDADNTTAVGGAGLRGRRWEPVVLAALVLARDIQTARLVRHDAEPTPAPRRAGQVRLRRPDDGQPSS